MLDVIVVGGGHAGIEAALITARLGCETALISLSLENIGKMPCQSFGRRPGQKGSSSGKSTRWAVRWASLPIRQLCNLKC